MFSGSIFLWELTKENIKFIYMQNIGQDGVNYGENIMPMCKSCSDRLKEQIDKAFSENN